MTDQTSPVEKCLNNNSIETKDANHEKRERYVDKLSAAEQAAQIDEKLKDLKQLCKDEIQEMCSFYQQHAIETIVRISIYMAQQYQKPDWHRFDILLIKHLRFLLDLQNDNRTEFENIFPLVSEIFWYFCEVDEIAHHFVNQLLDIWQQMLLKVDLKIRKSIFLTEKKNFENCIKFMKRVGCYAMQRKMLNVILSYVDAKDKDKFILVSSLFHVIGAETHDIFKRLIHLHQAVAAGEGAMECKKRYIMQIVNDFGAGTVVSKLIHHVWFDGKMVDLFPEFEAWLDFNLGTKTIEFGFFYKGDRKMARIDKYCVGLFKVENSETENSSVFGIEMINPLHFETMTNTTAHDVIILTEIRIKLTYGIFTEQLESILDNLLPGMYEFTVPPAKKKKRKKPNGRSINDTESSDNENGSSDDLLLVEDDISDPKLSQNMPKTQIEIVKLETKANIKNETKADLADIPFPKMMDHNVTKRAAPKTSTLITTETSVRQKVNIKMSQTKVEKVVSVSNSQPAELTKDSTESPIKTTDDPSEPIEQFGQNDDIPMATDFDDIMETTSIEKKNSNSNSDDTELKSTEIVVKAQVHCDIKGNFQSSHKVPKSHTKSQPKAFKPLNYNEITSIDFDQQHFDKKVAKKIIIEPSNDKENRSQNETSVSEEKVKTIVVESNKKKEKRIPVKRGRVAKPKPILPKNETETKVRRSSRTSSVKAQQKMSIQKDDVYEYDDDYDEFAVPEPPEPKRKTIRANSSTKNETNAPVKKAPVKRAPAKKQVDEEPKVKKPRKMYTLGNYLDSDDELQTPAIEKPSIPKVTPQIEDDQLTTASFESRDLDGMDNVLHRVNKNISKMKNTTEANKFNELFETPSFDRGQINEAATFSYRKYAMKSSYSRVRTSTDSAGEFQSKKAKTIQEDE